MKKAWSRCHSFHAVKALASPKLSKRATPKAPRQCKYIKHTRRQRANIRPMPLKAVYNTPHEASLVALLLTTLLELPDSYCVKTKAHKNAFYNMHAHPNLRPWGFRHR